MGIVNRGGFFFIIGLVLAVAWAGPCSGYSTYNVQIPGTYYGNLIQYQVPAIGNFVCGPVATTNCLMYFQNRYSDIYGSLLVPAQTKDLNYSGTVDNYDHLIATTQTLAGDDYLRTYTRIYTYHDDLIWGKRSYIEERVPGVTVYKAQDFWGWTNPQRPRPEFVQSGNPTWDFLYTGLLSSAAIEILFSFDSGGHFVSVCGFEWSDLNDDGIIQQNENAKLHFIDPLVGSLRQAQLWNSEGTLYTDYSGGGWISMAMSSVVVSEPGTVVVIATGLVGIAIRRRRWL